MDIKSLNARKKELLDQQETLLNKATESKVAFTTAEEEQFCNYTKELDSLNVNISRVDAIEKGKREVGTPSNSTFVPDFKPRKKGTYSNCTAEYSEAFWKSLSTRNFNNSALSEGGTAADGSFLVPNQTDPTIAPLAVIEASARKLSRSEEHTSELQS